jgi:GAF domain-containing protein/nitrogen-specific signal transduction histidine kinase
MDDANQTARQLTALYNTSLEISAQMDLDALLHTIVQRAVDLLGAHMGGLYLFRQDGQTLQVVVSYHLERDYTGTLIHVGEGVAGRIAQTGEPMMVEDYGRWEGRAPVYRDEPFRRVMGVPLRVNRRVIGVIDIIDCERTGLFSQEQAQLLCLFADHAAIAVEKTRLYAEANRRAEELATLNRIGLALTAGLEMDRVLEALDEQCQQIVPTDVFYVALYDDSTGIIHFARFRDREELLTGHPRDIHTSPSLSGHVILTRQTLYLRDTLDPAHTPPIPLIRAGGPGTRSYLGVPLIWGNQVVGVLSVQSYRAEAYTPDDIRLLETIATQAAIAIENARLFENERLRRMEMAAVQQASLSLTGSLRLSEVLDKILSAVLQLIRVRNVHIFLYADGRLTFGGAMTPEGRMVSPFSEPRQDGVTYYAARTGQPVIVEDTRQHPLFKSAPPDWEPFAIASLPLKIGQTVVGVMNLAFPTLRRLEDSERRILDLLAAQAAVTIENARLHQTTLDEQSRLHALIESNRDGIILNSLAGHILVVNTPALQMLNLPGPPADWLDRHVRDALKILRRVAPALTDTARSELRRIQIGNEPPSEGEVQAPPRTIHWMSLPVMSGDRPLGRLIVLRDVTQECAVEQLRENMVDMMVHDLRNPLTTITNALELLRLDLGDSLAADQRQTLDIASHQSMKMQDLVERILEISRLEQHRMPIKPTAVHLGDLVEEALRSQLPIARARDLQLTSDVPANLPPAWADPDVIGRVLQNLVGNAIKFTPAQGHIRVTARLRPDQGHPQLLVSVNDTGAGIPADIQDRLFQPFVRGNQRQRGNGLGLAFCRLALKAHGENIWVEHTSERGTTITFSLAAAVSDRTPQDAEPWTFEAGGHHARSAQNQGTALERTGRTAPTRG